jgi:hypothetical protein
VFLALGTGAAATTYYIDDNDNAGDVYTPTATGNIANNGLAPTNPALTVASVLTNVLAPGDIILIDTGTYNTNVVIGTNVNGVAGNPIVFQGSTATKPTGGGTTFVGSTDVFDIRGRYLQFRDILALGGSRGLYLNGSSFCEYERVYCISNLSNGLRMDWASNSNAFRRCIFRPVSYSGISAYTPVKGNYLENCIVWAPNSTAVISESGALSNMVGCILVGGQYAVAGGIYAPSAASYNILWGQLATVSENETLAELQRLNTNWHHNTVADPKFANANALDFHLLSASGFVSNGVWVTNPAVGYSPGIDFGARE